MNRKHEATIRQVEKFYENKFADEKVNASFSKVSTGPHFLFIRRTTQGDRLFLA